MTETILLGVLAQRRGEIGKTFNHDKKERKFMNDTRINQWMKRSYREGWKVV